MKQTKYIVLLFIQFFLSTSGASAVEKPQLTIICIIDQWAYHYIPLLHPYFNAAFKYFLNNGIVYHNAYHPHACPETATGHATLSTGTYAQNHGIISNSWVDENGNSIKSDKDSAENAAVFSPTELYQYGKSAANIMVDGLSDQLVLQQPTDQKRHVFSISLKSRAAIGTAGKLGKAIWYDTPTRCFTSSTAYFKELPHWITQFNSNKNLQSLHSMFWKPRYKLNSPAYQFKNIHNYEYAGSPQIIGKQISLQKKVELPYKDPIQKSPLGNQICLDLAVECINTHLPKNSTDSMVLWLELSALDYAGHMYGPECMETIDIIYHLDKQLQQFLKQVTKTVDKKKLLFILTADHGIEPIPELLAKRGIPARRLMLNEWIDDMNKQLAETVGVTNVLFPKVVPPYVYFDMQQFNALEQEEQNTIIKTVKEYLMKQPGVKQVWYHTELEQACFHENQLESYFKNQFYPGRSGQIIIQTDPYNILTEFKTGASHCTPYEANTHVPIIIYQKGVYEKQAVNEKVSTTQLANTVAHILNISKPSTSTGQLLPGITRS
ncbi:MAG TPA: alkaline phosphatase family protein [Candidatus Babeliales bacterium]|nr:alkaline phosphatase family protein [Candidatus Babeliales bacterium]